MHFGEVDAAVIGGGPAGLAVALALAEVGAGRLTVAAIGPQTTQAGAADSRTAALFGPSLVLLARLGIGGALEAACAPITGIRLVDETGGMLRAPEILFRAGEIGLARFGLNVPNGLLVDLLETRIVDTPAIARITAGVTAVRTDADRVSLTLSDGSQLSTRLAVAADGRGSITRTAAGIATRTWDYEQTAIVTRFEHSRPHDGISTELHRSGGPCTVVPLPGNASSLVWVERPAIARRLMALDDDAFRAALADCLKGLLGNISSVQPRRAFPLTGLAPDRFAANRIALAGEAAHVFPPIGAQGLNLGLRDAASLAECVDDVLDRDGANGADVGGDGVLAAYDRGRRLDVGSRTFGVDMLGRSLTSANPLVALARGFGLQLAHSVLPLRHAMIRAGLTPAGPLPRLMEPGDSRTDRSTAP